MRITTRHLSTAAVAGALAALTLVSAGSAATPGANRPRQAGRSGSSTTLITRDGVQVRLRRTPAAPRAAALGRPAVLGQAVKSQAVKAQTRFDIDGDGLDDIVTGSFTAPVGYSVIVWYSGLGRRDILSPAIGSSTRPNFGDELTSGDFNADGYADLAVANEGESVTGHPDQFFGGAVWIFYGGPDGIDPTTVQHFNQDTPGVPGDMAARGFFGHALAAGDLNADGYADLAVGAPGEVFPGVSTTTGSVTLLYGGPGGLSTSGVQTLSGLSPGLPAAAQSVVSFPSALAIGDVTGDRYPDLAATGGDSANGIAVVLPGSAAGVTTTGSSAVVGVAIGAFLDGDSIAVADLNGDSHADVIVGADLYGEGEVVYLPGTAAGIGTADARTITDDAPGMPRRPGPRIDSSLGDSFGRSLATGDVTGDGLPDVLVGAIGMDVDGVVDAGAVYLLPGSPSGLTTVDAVGYWEGKRRTAGLRPVPVPGTGTVQPTAYGYYGQAVAILNMDGAGALDPVVATDYLDTKPGIVQRLIWSPAALIRVRGHLVTGLPPALTPGQSWNATSFRVLAMGWTLLHS